MHNKTILALCLMSSALPLAAQQTKPEKYEVAATYTYVHTNAPPGGCGCFSLNGASGSLAYTLPYHFDIAGDLAVAHNGNVNGTNTSFTLTSYTFGPRYVFSQSAFSHVHLAPYAQVLAGGVYKSSSSGGASAFAMNLGGGVDWNLKRQWAIRVIEMDYYLTSFPNGVNSRQNNLKVSAGAAYRF